MPRVARLDTPGLLHHVMIRGIERRRIFKDDEDRENLMERLSFLLPKTKTQCYVRYVLSESEEQFTRKHRLKSQGYDFEKLLEMVCDKFQMEKEYVIRREKQRDRVRDLLCYWCNNKLGISMTDLSRKLGVTPAAVSIAVMRGEKAAKEIKYLLEI